MKKLIFTLLLAITSLNVFADKYPINSITDMNVEYNIINDSKPTIHCNDTLDIQISDTLAIAKILDKEVIVNNPKIEKYTEDVLVVLDKSGKPRLAIIIDKKELIIYEKPKMEY